LRRRRNINPIQPGTSTAFAELLQMKNRKSREELATVVDETLQTEVVMVAVSLTWETSAARSGLSFPSWPDIPPDHDPCHHGS
jgi:hypothetical protein